MIRSLDDDVTAFPHYDICIVGSGPAGITICAELADSGRRICVLESGTETTTEFADSLRKVESHGIEVLPDTRQRILGGTSHTWGGLCAPLDPVDFTARGWRHHLGWPITWEELVPYLRSAVRYGFPRLDAFACPGPFIDNTPAEPGWRNCEEKVFLWPANIARQNSPRGQPHEERHIHDGASFGLKYRHLFLKQDIDLILGATVVDLRADGIRGKTRVRSALCRNETGSEILITADWFVLAAGAIDNARLLLNSKNIVREGLGNESDQVGRYLMNHPRDIAASSGVIRVREWPHWLERYSERPYDGGKGYIGLRLREAQQLKMGALNSYIVLQPRGFQPWHGRTKIRAWREFTDRARAWCGRLDGRSRLATVRDLVHAAWKVFVSVPESVRLVMLLLMHHFSPRAPMMIGVVRFAEMEPRPENRVTLTADRDSLGVPIPHVVHVLSRRDLESVHRLHQQIAADLEAMGYGGELVETLAELARTKWEDGFHYLGTTRMGLDPANSVVNSDLRVHTVENLYVAGGSVFPTSGCANPTMTIVALSIRLAEHLRTSVLSPAHLSHPCQSRP
jgi:choline dehydrogenase-like flavoprotein